MSSHYEWLLSLWLRLDTPETFLAELRWHLGLVSPRPDKCTLGTVDPALAPSHAVVVSPLPGGEITSLAEQTPYVNRPPFVGLLVRRYVLDDDMHEVTQTLPEWLAPWSATEGWIGCAREVYEVNPWLNFYVSQGHAYAAEPARAPLPLVSGAPAFTARQTLHIGSD